MSRSMCSMPFTLTHQLRNSVFNAHRSQFRRYASNNLSFSSKSNLPFSTLRLETRTNFVLRNNAYKLFGVTTVGLAGFSLLTAQKEIHCEALPPKTHLHDAPLSEIDDEPLPPPPQSSVNVYELTFGTVCGICAGVFVKKGAKALAFVFGGVFVLLQYFGSLNLIRVDWRRMSSRFENLFYSRDTQGVKRAPSVGSLFRWIVDFLTADFQQRASFIAGFALGLRIG